MKTWHKVTGATAISIAAGLAFHFEGERLKTYRDVGGQPTICEGETQGVFMGMTRTHAQCIAWLNRDMQSRLDFVDHALARPQPDERRAALADFAYNEGNNALLHSLALRDINAGKIVQGCNALMNWDVAAGRHLAGLHARRLAERELCLEGITQETSP